MRPSSLVVFCASMLACGGDPAAPPDAGPGDAGPEPPSVAEPMLPAFACADGWSTPPDAPGCEPWPESGRADCGPNEVHLPGTPGCQTVGPPCPAGDWSDDLPVDRTVVFVHATASGGDGTRAAPFGSVNDALASGAVVALSKGTFAELLRPRFGTEIVGACVGETMLTTDVFADAAGIVTLTAGETTLRSLRVEGARPGIWVEGPAARARLADVVVGPSQGLALAAANGATLLGDGVSVESPGAAGMEIAAATVELDRSSIRDVVDVGLLAYGAESRVEVRGSVVAGVAATGRTPSGAALALDEGAEAAVERTVVEEATDIAMYVQGEGAHMSLLDSMVRDTSATTPTGVRARGLDVWRGAHATIARSSFENHGQLAMLIVDVAVEMADLVVRDTWSRMAAGQGGHGIGVFTSAVSIERALFDRNQTTSIAAARSSTRLALTDVVVRQTRPQAGDGLYGRGIAALDGATITVERGLVEDNREVGVLAGNLGSRIELTDAVVRNTLPAECEVCAGGFGLVAIEGGSIEARRFELADNALGGLALARGGAIDLHSGEIHGHPIGASVQTEGFDFARLSDGVVFRDNERNVDSMQLPVPEPTEPFER